MEIAASVSFTARLNDLLIYRAISLAHFRVLESRIKRMHSRSAVLGAYSLWQYVQESI